MVSRASSSPHGFAVVRGRGHGYRPRQVDQCVADLSQERDEAWERAARLTVLAREMEAEADRLNEAAAQLAPQTYDSLSARARHLLALTEEEALQVRVSVQEEARRAVEAAERQAQETREAAQVYARALRAEADERAKRGMLDDRASAGKVRAAARAEAQEVRGAGLAVLREKRQRAAALLADQETEQTECWEAAERQVAERVSELDARNAELTVQAEAGLRTAQTALGQAQDAAGRRHEGAAARAAELLAEARMREERIGRETQRLLREHHAQREEVQIHLDRILSGLQALPAGVGETSSEETS